MLFSSNSFRNIVGVVAQNGGGKTTLFKTLLGTYKPTRGEIVMLGIDGVETYSMEYFRKISVVFQENVFIRNYTVKDQMSLIANVMGEDDSQIGSLLAQMGIQDTLKQKVDKLSGGQQRRMNIAMSMLRKNAVLRILDEPACGVDIESRKWLWQYLRKKHDGMTLLTTHIMEEAEELCDEVVILKEGQLVCHGSLLYAKENLSRGY